MASQATTPARPWLAPHWRDLLLRTVMAVGFLAALLGMLTHFAPAPPAPQARVIIPPLLPDPFSLLPIAPESARVSNAAVPIEAPAIAAKPFLFSGTLDERQRAADCLAAAQWYEAGDDPVGQRAVAQVVLNRARHPAFPGTVCGVVFQGSDRKTGCQFTFTCDGSMALRKPTTVAWTRARSIALAALAGSVDPAVGLATHYHADYVVPYWRDSLVKLAQVGAHIFYSWPGYWGTPGVMARIPTGGPEPFVPLMAPMSSAHGNALLAFDTKGLDGDVDLAGAVAPADPQVQQLVAHYGGNPANGGTEAGGVPQQQTDRFDLALDPKAMPGSYAVRAFALCKDKPRCVVLGKHDPAAAALAFVYVHDSKSGAEGTWWNCDETPRQDRAQCLPQGATARDPLIARWL